MNKSADGLNEPAALHVRAEQVIASPERRLGMLVAVMAAMKRAPTMPLARKEGRQDLEQSLKVIQTRLGTTNEQPGDFSAACEIAHRLNNIYTPGALMNGLRPAKENAGRHP